MQQLDHMYTEFNTVEIECPSYNAEHFSISVNQKRRWKAGHGEIILSIITQNWQELAVEARYPQTSILKLYFL